MGRSTFQAAGGECWADPMGPQPLSIHSESQCPATCCLQRAPGQCLPNLAGGHRTEEAAGWLGSNSRDCPTSGKVTGLPCAYSTITFQLQGSRFGKFHEVPYALRTFHLPSPSWSLSRLQETEKVKRALAWAPEHLALPLAVHVTLGRSRTSPIKGHRNT